MRVLFWHHAPLGWGGSERWIEQTGRFLQERGHEVAVRCVPLVGGKGRKMFAEEMQKPDVTYLTSPLDRMLMVPRSPVVAGLHTYMTFRVRRSFVRLLRERKAMPLVSTLAARLTSRGVMGSLDALHMHNPFYSALSCRKRFLIPDFVDERLFYPGEKTERFTVLYASRKSWDKGYDVWLSVKRLLSSVGFDMQETNGGTPGQVAEQMRRAHVVVVPSRLDSFGLVQIEALASGTPVVTSAIPEHLALGLDVHYESSASEFVVGILSEHNRWARGAGDPLKEREKAKPYFLSSIGPRLEKMLSVVADPA